ncbi:MAG: MarR family winged helix-turn-helix transcriptional regulator [Anaerovoracaceae bacterium]
MLPRHLVIRDFSIIHRFSISYQMHALKGRNIAGHQIGYIMYVCAKPGVSQEELASFLGLNKGAVAKGIRPLVDDGFINRIPNPRDKRAYELYPTNTAISLRNEADGIIQNFEAIITKGMTEEEQTSLKRLLHLACENILEASKTDGGFPKDFHHFHKHGEHCCPTERRFRK